MSDELLDDRPGWHEELPMILGAAFFGNLVPWVMGFIAVLAGPIVFGEDMPELFPLAATLIACTVVGFGFGWTRYLGWMIAGVAIWASKDFIFGVPVSVTLVNVGLISVAYLLGGLLRLPFRSSEESG